MNRLFLAAFVLVLVAGCRPPLRIVNDGEGVTIDVQTLGEYQTSVSRLRLTDTSTKTVVWELAVKSGEPQIWTVRLHAGSNARAIEAAQAGTSFEVLVPKSSDSFTLVQGRNYLVEVWAPNGRRSSVTFEL